MLLFVKVVIVYSIVIIIMLYIFFINIIKGKWKERGFWLVFGKKFLLGLWGIRFLLEMFFFFGDFREKDR